VVVSSCSLLATEDIYTCQKNWCNLQVCEYRM